MFNKNYILSFLLAFCASVILIVLFLPLLKKLRLGQYILSYVKEHFDKSGTPTMGGLAFILAACMSCVVFVGFKDKEINLCLAIGIAFMFVGFLDDIAKVRFKKNQGLSALQKLIFQFAIAIIASIFAYKNGITEVFIPILNKFVNLKFWYVPLAGILFVFFTNCVNLTDGLDALAGSVSVVYFSAFAVITILQKDIFYSNTNYSLLSMSLCGAIVAFLIFNTNKASLFMGDTGSLSIGGFAASIGILSGNLFFVLILGIMYVFSGISVILQVFYFKKTKKRIFLMSPYHHHLQLKGFSEAKITYVYTVITLIVSLIAILTLL